ncbi:membrane protein [Pandoraea sputorum]|uniref:RDD family n=3 Tax=Pandoraea sputorum TaxID=93222 RepID=A0A239SFR6_9BURK|nr:RDD family [Pandoraea sputorum]VVD92271.1 membrane protein [Pandoraea sputorum]
MTVDGRLRAAVCIWRPREATKAGWPIRLIFRIMGDAISANACCGMQTGPPLAFDNKTSDHAAMTDSATTQPAKPPRSSHSSPAAGTPDRPNTQDSAEQQSYAVPTLRRRLLSMVYESLLLFGVLFLAGYLFSALTQQRSGLMYRHAMQTWLFLVLGAYFVWFWTHGGQTLAMKTWKIRLVDAHGSPVRPGRAVLRYVLAWLWVLPAMALDWALGLTGWNSVALLAGWLVIWALAMRVMPDHQFVHDRLAGTRLVSVLGK